METLTLTTPIAASSLIVSRLILDWDGVAIYVVLRAPDGRRFEYTYGGAEATTLMQVLNKANLSVKSLHRRVVEKLMADHPELAGAISEVAD
ncbi:MAG: hypothetical protein NUV51_09255 [Sulfuricaulis sp.]|nr:hypothetical protein [Sulfuricaulis sp.]